MELEYKSDFDECLGRFEAWWDCQIIDRPPVSISVRSEKPAKPQPRKTHASHRERAFDIEYSLDQFQAWCASSVFLAESFPMFYPNVGPEVCSTLFGCQLEFSEHSSWSIPNCGSCREILSLKLDLQNPYWQAIHNGTRLSLDRGRGKWITGLADLHTNGDLLASMRDPQNLCMDMIDDPQAVRDACDHVTKFFPAIYGDLYDMIRRERLPSCTWTPALAKGRMYATSCDFICMISPEMFRAAILPSIKAEMKFLDRSIFHLDGPGALRHLDDLLACEDLHAVQWVYGAGRGPAKNWIEVYKRIQAGGKAIQLIAEDLDDAKAVAEHLKPQGVWFTPNGSYSLDEAKQFLDWTTRWAAGKA